MKPQTIYVSPPENYIAPLTAPTKEDIDREKCAKCHWRHPETCRICKQEGK